MEKFEILWELSKCDTKGMKWASALGQRHLYNNSVLPQTFDLLKQTQENTLNDNNNSVSAKCNKMQCAYIEDAVDSLSTCPPVVIFPCVLCPEKAPWRQCPWKGVTVQPTVPSPCVFKFLAVQPGRCSERFYWMKNSCSLILATGSANVLSLLNSNTNSVLQIHKTVILKT